MAKVFIGRKTAIFPSVSGMYPKDLLGMIAPMADYEKQIEEKTMSKKTELVRGFGLAMSIGAAMDEIRRALGVSEEEFHVLGTPEGRPHLERMIAGLKVPAVESDTIIRVDRSIRPVYPSWVKQVMHLELENTGPAEYDLFQLELWLHEDQKNGGRIEGHKLYEYLKNNKMLESCLSLRDGEEIQKKGLTTFRKFFGGKAIPLWKSVVQRVDGSVSVPCLVEDDERVAVFWLWLVDDWDDDCPAARLAR